MAELRVVVDVLPVHFGGGGSVILQQLEALERTCPELVLEVLAAPWNADALRQKLSSTVREVAVHDGPRRVAWEQTQLLGTLGRSRADLLYCPANSAPLSQTAVPIVVMQQNPNMFGRGRRLPHNRRWNRRARVGLARASTKRADAVVAGSHALAADIVADLPEVQPHLTVVPFGASSLPEEAIRPALLPASLDAFVVSLANDAPHKRLDDIVMAWGRAHTAAPTPHPSLVMAGVIPSHRRVAQLQLVPPTARPHVHFLGPVTDRREVSWLLRNARASVAASAIESFGLVTIEAGSVGCPLILSDIPAHREVAGRHATFVPVGAVDAIASALREVGTSTAPREPWDWAWTWDEHAQRLAEVLREARRSTRSRLVLPGWAVGVTPRRPPA